jgi:glycosidase
MNFSFVGKIVIIASLLSANSLQEALGAATKSAQDFRDETIYFVMPSRFSDGDPLNNFYNRDRIEIGDPHWRGDFQGLINNLDYILKLGFSAIWITPPVENRSGLDYHGYHAYDWNKVDPRLESPGGTYRDFIRAAKSKGLKVIQDVVINHSSNYGIRDKVFIDRLPIKYFREDKSPSFPFPYQQNLGDYQRADREDNDNTIAPDWFRKAQGNDPEGKGPFWDALTGTWLPKAGHRPDLFFATNVNTLPSDWYHLDGYMQGGDWENPRSLQRKHLAGDTMDLATGNSNVQSYLNAAVERYLDWGVDAIRVDTTKHIERDELLSKYVNVWKQKKPDLFVFGEVLVKGMGLGNLDPSDNGPSDIRPWWYTRTGSNRFDPNSGGDSGLSVLDFGLMASFRDNVLKGTFAGIGAVFGWDWIFGDATKLVTFFQNHDVGPDNDFKYRFAGEDWKAMMAYNLLWMARGVPALYYGEEVKFQAGKPQDIDGPQTKLSETGRAYFGDLLNDQASLLNHPISKRIQLLNSLRRQVPALRRGQMKVLEESNGGLVFERRAPGSVAWIALCAGNDQRFQLHNLPSGAYLEMVTGRRTRLNAGETLEFDLPQAGLGVWVPAEL